MTDKAIRNLTAALLLFTGFTLVYFLISTLIDGYFIWGKKNIDFAVTGQVGDFIGGFLGTVINGAAFYFLYLTLNEQRKSSEKQGFETKLFELIHLHRENVSEPRYTKDGHQSESRKVFRVIAKEFIDCLHEVKRFAKMYEDLSPIQAKYELKLVDIRKKNKIKSSVLELALIDLAYNFIYFGLSTESQTILHNKFYRRYDNNYAKKLQFFLKLKPKRDDKELFKSWLLFKNLDVKNMKYEFEKLYNKRRAIIENNQIKTIEQCLFSILYYNGHQHRLGHYFRHLFQSFKFVSIQNFLSDEDKYFFAKTLRVQLSTYEQLLLLFNSISSLGMHWEYIPDLNNIPVGCKLNDFKFITRYNLIKNLPGSQYLDITYRRFYKDVHYEYLDDITYSLVA